MSEMPDLSLATKMLHAGALPRVEGAVTTPIFQSSTFLRSGDAGYHDLPYLRLSNSRNHRVLAARLAAAEGAEDALVTASGMAAVSTTLLSQLRAGDHVIAQSGLYGGTHTLIEEVLPRYGIAHTFVDGDDPDSWERARRPETKLFYVETITNPQLAVPALDAVVAFADEHELLKVVDNTIASPVNFKAASRGFDLSLHSATKYLNGHNDLIAGAVIGRADLVEEVRHHLNHLGGILDAHACFLLERGLKTLPARMAQQSATALRVARFLDGHQAVARVYYPGLTSHPSHERAARLLDGFSAMVSFEVRDDAVRFLDRLALAVDAVSLGGVDTLVSRPAGQSHEGLTQAEREAIGISDRLIRLSVGLEGADDLIADLDQALTD